MQEPAAVSADSVRAALRKVFASPSYEWSRTRSLWEYLLGAWRWLEDALDRMQQAHPVAFFALMLMLTIVGLAILTHIVFVLRRALRPPAPKDAEPALALPVAHDARWHLGESRHLAAAGRFPEALTHRFVALILQLESRGAVVVKASRTPAEYAREARLDPDSRGAMGALVTTLYTAVFGGAPLDEQGFATFDRDAGLLAQHAQTV